MFAAPILVSRREFSLKKINTQVILKLKMCVKLVCDSKTKIYIVGILNKYN